MAPNHTQNHQFGIILTRKDEQISSLKNPCWFIIWLVVYLPLRKIWDYYSQYMENMFETTNQLLYGIIFYYPI
jgi:hypothetical protein